MSQRTEHSLHADWNQNSRLTIGEQTTCQSFRTTTHCKVRTRDLKTLKQLSSNSIALISLLLIITHEQSAIIIRPTEANEGLQIHTNQRPAHFADLEDGLDIQRVAVGRSIRFKCVVNDIGEHRVAWFHKDRRLLLAIDNRTIAWRDRIQVSSQANSVFFLQIDNVQLGDKGHYQCQINTEPPKTQTHVLDIVKSPQIKEQETTVKVEPVKEWSSIELRCVADGIPKPVIKWRRESQSHELPMPGFDGELGLAGNDGDSAEGELAVLKRGALVGPMGDINGNKATTSSHDKRKVAVQLLLDNGADEDPISRLEPEEEEKEGAPSSFQQHAANKRHLTGGLDHDGEEPLDAVSARVVADGRPGSSLKRRQTSQMSLMMNSSKPFLAEGELLRIERVSRYDMGFYICIASNGVPPSISQRIFLPVSFPQRTTISTTQESAARSGGKLDTVVATSSQWPTSILTFAGKGSAETRALSSSKLASPEPNTARSGQPRSQQRVTSTDDTLSGGSRRRQKVSSDLRPVNNGTGLNSTTVMAGVGSGRNYQRYRQLKATRSSSSAASSASSLAAQALTISAVTTSFASMRLAGLQLTSRSSTGSNPLEALNPLQLKTTLMGILPILISFLCLKHL